MRPLEAFPMTKHRKQLKKKEAVLKFDFQKHPILSPRKVEVRIQAVNGAG